MIQTKPQPITTPIFHAGDLAKSSGKASTNNAKFLI